MALDRYGYVYNNPLKFRDQTGFDPDVIIPSSTPTVPAYSNPLAVSPQSTPKPIYPTSSNLQPEPLPAPSPYMYSQNIAPPDFGNLDQDGRPPPPDVQGLPDDQWEWNPPGQNRMPGGWKNKADKEGRIFLPDPEWRSRTGKEGEDAHWDVYYPNGRRKERFPSNPQWGRGGQRSNPGTYNPGTGMYEIALHPDFYRLDSRELTNRLLIVGGSGLTLYGIWMAAKILSPACGPAAPVCAIIF